MNWPAFLAKLAALLDKLPGLLGAFGIGYKVGSKETQELKSKLGETELKKEFLENEIAVKDRNRHVPDRIRDFINRTRKSRPKPPDSGGEGGS